MMQTPPEDKNNIFNGTKYISLSQKSQIDPRFNEEYGNAFAEYIYDKLCIVIDNFNNVIYPNLVDWDYLSPEETKKILFSDSDERRSYYQDEVQTKEMIPSSKFIAIGYPYSYFEYTLGKEKNNEQIEKLREVLKKHNLDIPIVDSTHYDFANTKEKIKEYTLK
jgi:hypothetical protein